MTDCPAPAVAGDDPPGGGEVPAGRGEVPAGRDPAPACARWAAGAGRVSALWHRVRSGEDPWAFGAVVVVVALAAGVLWFWAGARHGGVAVASASPGSPKATAARSAAQPHHRSGDGAPQSPDAGGAGPAGGDPGRGAGDPAAGAAAGVPPAAASGGPTTTGPALVVHVAGAVAHAGLYHLPAGSRVADAVAVAGGGLVGADLDRLNLAARLADGQRVYVVRRGEPPPPAPAASGLIDGGGGDGADTGASGLAEPVDLNAAGLAALDSLPGVGPATARAILEQRARMGGFRSTRDLLRVPGIGEGRFARLKDHVRV
jgi:competence protein ComEA